MTEMQPGEKPMLFTGPMARATLEGRKTQTRRVVKLPQAWQGRGDLAAATVDAGFYGPGEEYLKVPFPAKGTRHRLTCPYGGPGERLWVRETYALVNEGAGTRPVYAADENAAPLRWKPSVSMPRAASRILLDICAVRVQRVQDISEEDAQAEGVAKPLTCVDPVTGVQTDGWRGGFACLWDSVNGKRPERAWSANGWVWAITFRRIEP